MKIKTKTVMIIIDIIVLIGVAIIYVNWSNKHNNDEQPDYQEIKYKRFTYKIPNDIEYIDSNDEFSFTLKSADYEARVEILIDEDKKLLNKKDNYYDLLIQEGYDVDKPEIIDIDKNKVVIINYRDEKNKVLCYFYTVSPYVYEVQLYNSDNSLKTDYLESIVNILLQAEFDDALKENTYYSVVEID